MFVVLANNVYSVLKSFAHLESAPAVPDLEIPGLDIVTLAKGFGCQSAQPDTTEEIAEQINTALRSATPTVVVPTRAQLADLG